MKHTLTLLALLLAPLDWTAAAEVSTSHNRLEPVRLQTIELGGFWKQQAKRLTVKWLPHCVRQMEKGGKGQELLNLIALGKVQRGEPADWKYTGAPGQLWFLLVSLPYRGLDR